MAISPQVLIEQQQVQIAEEVSRLDKKCEDALKDQFRINQTVSVAANANMLVIEGVKALYEAQGWQVVYSDSQKDGAYLTFSVRPNRLTGMNGDR